MGFALAVVLSVSGCSGDAGPSSGSSAAATSGRTVASGEAAIRALVESERAAVRNWDVDTLVADSCAKLKDATRDAITKTFQPMSAMGTPDEAAHPDPRLVDALVKRHAGVTPQTVVSHGPMVVEDGQWKDCSPPAPPAPPGN